MTSEISDRQVFVAVFQGRKSQKFHSKVPKPMWCTVEKQTKMKNIVYMRELKTTWKSQDQRKKQ